MQHQVLTPRHLMQYLQWSSREWKMTRVRWKTDLFSDEYSFLLSRADGRTRVYRRRGDVMLQIECTKLTDLVVTVSLCEQEFVMVVGRLLYMWQMHWRATGIEKRFCNITSFRTRNSMVEYFSITMHEHMLVKGFCTRKTFRHYIGLSVQWIWTKYNVNGMHWFR